MNRQFLINELKELKAPAIKFGWDWPIKENYNELNTEELIELINALKDFIEFEQQYNNLKGELK